MKIVINVSNYYDWLPLSQDEQAIYDSYAAERETWAVQNAERLANCKPGEPVTVTSEPIIPALGILKPDQNGNMLKRGLVQEPTFTEISIPPGQVQHAKEAMIAQGLPCESDEEAIAWLLKYKVMPHHAPAFAWTNITVETGEETDADTATKLKKLFNIGAVQ